MSAPSPGAGVADPAPVLLVVNPSSDLYGSDRMMLELVRGVAAADWRVVVSCSADGPLMGPLRRAGAETRVTSTPVVRKSMLSVRGLARTVPELAVGVLRMIRLLRSVRPDLVLLNTVTIPFWLPVTKVARLPTVVYVHEAEASLGRLYRLAMALPLLLADHVVFNSLVSQRVNAVGPLTPRLSSSVVSNGVQGPPAVTPAREDLDGAFHLVYVGRLSPRKGVDLAVRAVAALVDRGIDARLELVGAVFPGYEWYETELRELVDELGLGGRVVFQGFQPSVWPFLARADLAVVPSRLDESFGNALVEALLAARPVVASDHTGLREAAAGFDAVVLAPADDLDAWVAALTRVHEGWTHFRGRATEDAAAAESRYGTARFHRQIQAVLVQLLGRGRCAGMQRGTAS